MNKRKEHSWLESKAPLGIELAKEITIFVSGMLLSLLYSLIYLANYVIERNNLYERIDEERVLRAGAIMPSFETLIEGRMIGFGIVIVILICISVYHYIYHYMDSKLVYLMKRLPSRWELHKRCLVLPIVGIIVTLVCSLLLWFIYYGIYLLFTPQQCLPI